MVLRENIRLFTSRSGVFLLLMLFSVKVLTAQVDPVFNSSTAPLKKVEATFVIGDIELKQGEIVSNVLRVSNNTKEVVRFTLDLTFPLKWKLMGNQDKVYEINPFDSVFVPVRLIPSQVIGNTHFIINSFLVEVGDGQIGNASFFVHCKKLIKWQLSAGPTEKIYFLNNEKSAAFNLNVFNEGNEQQDILLEMNQVGKNIIISDTNNKFTEKKFHNLGLNPLRDTTLYFKMRYFDGQRNQKRVDVDNLAVNSVDAEKKHTLYVQTRQARQTTKNVFKRNKKVDFIRLGNRKKVNPYGTSILPLTAESNIYNLISGQPIMSLALNGHATLANNASLVYSTQTSYSTFLAGKDVFYGNKFFLGYFHPTRGSVQVGNVGGGSVANGISTGGKGVNVIFNPDKHHSVGAFLTGDNNSFSFVNKISYGVSHRMRVGSLMNFFYQVGRTVNKPFNITTDYWNVRTTLPLKKHHLLFGVTGTTTNFADTLKRKGNAYNVTYGGSFFNKKLHSNIHANYFSKYLTQRNNSRLYIYSNLRYDLTKIWNIALQSNYNSLETTYLKNFVQHNGFNTFLNNQLMFARKLSAGSVSTSVFYNMTETFGSKANAKGLGIDYNFVEPQNNLRFTTSLKGAYNQFENNKNLPQYFTFQFTNLLQYKTVTAHARYMYGPNGPDTTIYSSGLNYPQNVFFTLQHQYQFRNERFVLQTNLNYSYLNRYYSNSFGMYPEFYYRTFSGWRFKLSLSYNINSSNYLKAVNYANPNANPTGENDLAPKVNKSYNISFGVRKEFGIPFPKFISKKRFTNVEFIAFLDINGNRKMDRDEVPLENIVIKLGDHEILSNQKGRAYLENVQAGTYRFVTHSLVNLEGWFSVLEDSLQVTDQKVQYIPFVRGVKIYGNIILDREKYAKEMEARIELSKIRITATDSLGKAVSTLSWDGGLFQLYVPYGTYVLTMDETILDGDFTLAKNNITITLKEGMESLYNSFYIIEKRRKIKTKKFDSKGNEIKDK